MPNHRSRECPPGSRSDRSLTRVKAEDQKARCPIAATVAARRIAPLLRTMRYPRKPAAWSSCATSTIGLGPSRSTRPPIHSGNGRDTGPAKLSKVPTRTSDAPELADRYSMDNGTNSPFTRESTASTRKTAVPAASRRDLTGRVPSELSRLPALHEVRFPDRFKNPPRLLNWYAGRSPRPSPQPSRASRGTCIHSGEPTIPRHKGGRRASSAASGTLRRRQMERAERNEVMALRVRSEVMPSMRVRAWEARRRQPRRTDRRDGHRAGWPHRGHTRGREDHRVPPPQPPQPPQRPGTGNPQFRRRPNWGFVEPPVDSNRRPTYYKSGQDLAG